MPDKRYLMMLYRVHPTTRTEIELTILVAIVTDGIGG